MADPITLALIGTAVGGLAGGVGTILNAGKSGPSAPGMPSPAPPVQNPVGSPTGNTSNGPGPSFLAAAAPPAAGSLGQKSLLGQ